MIRAVIKGLALLAVAAIFAVPAVAVFVDDDLVRAIVDDIPGARDNADAILAAKRGIDSTLGDYAGGAIAGARSLYRDFRRFAALTPGQRVVIDLPPPKRPSPAMAPEPPPPAPGAESPAPAPPAQAAKPAVPTPPPTAAPKANTPASAPQREAPSPAPGGGSSAEQNFKLGYVHYEGIGVDKDFKKAADYLRQAAGQGHADAQYLLGIMSYLGQGTEKDFAVAVKWFQMAAEQDHARAQYDLGYLYFEGRGVAQDNLQAYMWIDRAAVLGHEKAVRARDILQKHLPEEIFKQ